MFSQQARNSIDFIFRKVAKSTFALQPEHSCIVTPLNGTKADQFPEKDVIVLTISSLLFRLVMILHVNDSPPARRYFSNDSENRDLADALSETLNLCSGAMNRELLRYFPHLGMSTPYILDSRCLKHLKQLKPEQVSCYELNIDNDAVRLHLTLCLCAYAPVDFSADMSVATEETGELELF